MTCPVNIERVKSSGKNYCDPIFENRWDLIKRTAQVAIGIFTCTAFVTAIGLLIQAHTTIALPAFFSQCLVSEAVMPNMGSCLIFGFVIAITEKCFEEFKKRNIPQNKEIEQTL